MNILMFLKMTCLISVEIFFFLVILGHKHYWMYYLIIDLFLNQIDFFFFLTQLHFGFF